MKRGRAAVAADEEEMGVRGGQRGRDRRRRGGSGESVFFLNLSGGVERRSFVRSTATLLVTANKNLECLLCFQKNQL